MRGHATLATLALLALAGCAASGPAGPGATAGTAPEGFQCPPAGTVVVLPEGRSLTFSGASPTDPFICLASNPGTGAAQRRLGNQYLLPIPDEENVRRGFAALWPLTPGRSTSFLHDVSTPDGSLIAFNTRWEVLGPRVIQIGGRDRQVLALQNVTATARPGYAGTWLYFYDVAARTIVGGDLTVQQGFNQTPSWRAVSVTVPGGS